MSEVIIKAWFDTHPFWRAEAIAVVSAVSGMAVHDYMAFKNAQAADPDGLLISFNPFIAMRRYALAALVGVLPPIVAVLYRVLGL